MKLISILLSTLLLAATSGKPLQNHSSSRGTVTNATNDVTSTGYGNLLAARDRQVDWLPLDEDQEACAYGEAKTIGEKVILTADCRKVVDYVTGRSGYWTVTGYGRGDIYASLVNWGTCSFEVARVDDQDLYFL